MTNLETLLSTIQDVKVIDKTIDYKQYIPLDLSISNLQLQEKKLESSSDFDLFIENYLSDTNSKVAFGGYLEQRNLYKRSSIFNDEASEERNIHIGLDLWIKSGTKVLAALDGKVHSFNFNSGLGNYGPTIILEHTIKALTFHTLYGHLSQESIEELEVGTQFKKGDTLATLGISSVNGDYAPHLHFQIIENIENNFGDYPGVCATKDLDYFIKNCPNPNLLLKIV